MTWYLSPLNGNDVIITDVDANLSPLAIYLPSLNLIRQVVFFFFKIFTFLEVAKFIRKLSPVNGNDIIKADMYVGPPIEKVVLKILSLICFVTK